MARLLSVNVCLVRLLSLLLQFVSVFAPSHLRRMLSKGAIRKRGGHSEGHDTGGLSEWPGIWEVAGGSCRGVGRGVATILRMTGQ